MSDKLDVTIGIKADASGVEAGIGRAKRSLSTLEASARGMAAKVSESGKAAGAGMEVIGAGSEKAAQKVARETRNMERSLQQLLAKMEGGSRESRAYWERMASFKGADLSSLNPLLNRLDGLSRRQAEAAASARSMAAAADVASNSFGRLSSALAIAGVGFSAQSLISWSDGYTKLTAQLKNATSGAQEYAQALSDVKSISTTAQAGVGELAVLYARISSSTKELGVSQAQVAQITETVALSLKANGASAAEASSAMLQLSQAFGSGVLRGEEFNAVYEAAPNLLRNLADAMGVPQGKLREMASDGKLTADVLAKYLPQSLEKVRKEAESMATIGGSFTDLNNKLMEFVGASAQSSGAAKAISSSISGLANNLELLSTAAGAVALVMTARYVGSMKIAQVETIKTTAAAIAQQVALTRAAAAIGGYSATATARMVAMTGAARAASLAMGALGGPFGLAITAIGLGAAAFYSFGDSAKEAAKSIGGLDQPLEELKKRLNALPPEKRVSVMIDIEQSRKDAIKEVEKQVDDLIQSVAGTSTIKLPLDKFEALTEEIRKTAKSGGDLTPVLQKAAAAGNVSEKLLQTWLDLAANIRAAKKEAETAAGVIAGAAGKDPRDNFPTPAQSEKEYYAELYKSQQFLAERNDKITKQFAADIEGLGQSLATGAFGQGEEAVRKFAEAVAEANKQRHASTEAGKAEAAALREAEKGAKSGQSAYQSLAKSITEKLAAQRQELIYGSKLTDIDKLRIRVEQEMTGARKAGLQAMLDVAKANERELTARAALIEMAEIEKKARQDVADAAEKAVSGFADSNKTLREEIELIGLSEEAQHAITQARLQAQITVKEQHLAELQRANDVFGFMSREQIALEEQIRLLKERLGLLDDKKVRDANAKAQERLEKEWEKTSQLIGDTLADYIMGGGKDAATYLKRLFATLVLQPVVQTMVGGVLGTGVAGASGVATGGAGNLMSLIQQGYGAFTSPLFSNFGMGVAGNIQQLGGTLFGKGFESLGSSVVDFGNSVAGFSDAINVAGDVFGYGAAIYKLSQGQYGSAVGTAIGTALGGPIGAVLGSTLGGFVDSIFGGNPHEHSGGVYSASGARGDVKAMTGMGSGAWGDYNGRRQNFAVDDALKSTVEGLQSAYQSLGERASKSLRALDVYAAFATNPISTDQDAYGYLRVLDRLTGQTIASSTQRDGQGLGNDPQQAFNLFGGKIANVFVQELLAADLPGWIDGILNGIGDKVTLESFQTALQQIDVIDTGFAVLAHQMSMFAGISGGVQTALLNVSGGMDALIANAQGYYVNFYSEQEKLDAVVASLASTFAKYGAEMPNTADQYRKLVEQQMAAGDAGAEFAAVLLGMQGIFKEVSDSWQKELSGLAAGVSGFFADLQSAIDGLSADVATDRKAFLRGNQVQPAVEIAAGIVGAQILAPSNAAVVQAGGGVASAAQASAAAKAAADAALEQYQSKQTAADTTSATLSGKSAEKQRLQAALQAEVDWVNSLWDGGVNSGYKYGKKRSWTNQSWANQDAIRAQLAALEPSVQAAQQEFDRLKAIATTSGEASQAAAQALEAAQKALHEAQQAELQAKADYAAQINQFVIDAGASVGKLSDLRGEVVSFYEAQAQAVQAMLQSAGNLRSVVDSVRLGQLSTAQTAQELGNRYATDYAMALATTGSTRAGYVDSLAGNLQGLSEAMKAEALSGTEWRVQTAKLLAQATSAAGLLEGDAASDNYQDVTLGLLDSIDKALAGLGGVTKSAEQVIADAVNNGTQAQLGGLRAIVAALTGKAVPAFAAGGMHTGGLRLVGERGPELEVTGPARYWNANQTQAMLGGGGGGNSERTEKLLAQLIEENRVQAARIVDLQLQWNKMAQRWDSQGMPNERKEDPAWVD